MVFWAQPVGRKSRKVRTAEGTEKTVTVESSLSHKKKSRQTGETVHIREERRGEERKEKGRRKEERRKEKRRKEKRREEKMKEKMKKKKIMMWTDGENGVHRRKLN